MLRVSPAESSPSASSALAHLYQLCCTHDAKKNGFHTRLAGGRGDFQAAANHERVLKRIDVG